MKYQDTRSYLSLLLYNDILMAGKDAFFPDYDPLLNSLHIADSFGKVIKSTGDDWTLRRELFCGNGKHVNRTVTRQACSVSTPYSSH